VSAKPGAGQFKHPTIADAYADIVSSDPQKLQYYLHGAAVERIMSEVSCGKPSTYGTSIVVPPGMYSIVSRRLFETEERHDELNFVAYRCDADFLKLYMKDRKLKPLDFLPAGGMLSAYPEVDLFATLCTVGVPSTKDRKIFIEHCFKIAVRMPEPSFVISARYAPIFGDDKTRDAVRRKFVATIVPEIKKRVADAWGNSSSVDDAHQLDLLRQAAVLAEEDPRYRKDVNLRNVRRRVEGYLKELNENSLSNDDSDDSLFDPAEATIPEKAGDTVERSVFDDVDA